MADENVDSDYQGHPYRRRRLTVDEEIARLRRRGILVDLPDGSVAVRTRSGLYHVNEGGIDFERPVEERSGEGV